MTPTPDQTPERRDADCPICGKFARNWNSNNCKLSCSDTSCPGFKIDLHPNEWNHRPLEDALRARLAEAEKVRDAAYREAEILRTNATYVKKVLDCANRYMPDLVKGAITVERAIQERDTLRATNATLVERVRRLEEALNAADSVMWMAERYAEGGGSNGPEMQDYLSATRIVLKVRGSYHNPSPTPGAAVGKEGE